MKRWLPALAAAFLITTAGSARADDIVRIGYLRAPNDLTLAKAHGSLDKALAEQHAKVEWAGPFAAAAPALEALNAGSIDITPGSSTASITALAANIPMVIFNYQKMLPASEGIVVPKDSPIKTIKDLNGHTVAVNRGGTGEYLLMRALDRNGIDPAGVKRVYLSPSDSGPSFTQGHVDAWATWDPFVTIALRSYNGRLLADGGAIGSDNAVVMLASRDFAQKKPALLKAVFDVLEAENAWSLTHKAEAGKIWAAEMRLPEEMGPAIGEANAAPTRAVSSGDVAQIGRIADWYVSSGIVPKRPDVEAGVVKLGS